MPTYVFNDLAITREQYWRLMEGRDRPLTQSQMIGLRQSVSEAVARNAGREVKAQP